MNSRNTYIHIEPEYVDDNGDVVPAREIIMNTSWKAANLEDLIEDHSELRAQVGSIASADLAPTIISADNPEGRSPGGLAEQRRIDAITSTQYSRALTRRGLGRGPGR
jgi:hypothetical protein